MKYVVFGLVLAGTLAMAWLWFQPVCQGGHVVRNEAECAAHFSVAFCRASFARTASIAARAGSIYNSDTECRDIWPVCDPRVPQGFGPRPSHWCLVEAAGSAPGRIEPSYSRRPQ